MTTPEPPRILFPCHYTLRIVGDAVEDFQQQVVAAVTEHAELAPDTGVRSRPSRNGRFLSVTLTILATGEPQLKSIHAALQATGHVHMVL